MYRNGEKCMEKSRIQLYAFSIIAFCGAIASVNFVPPFLILKRRKRGHKVPIHPIRSRITFDSVTNFFSDRDFMGAFRMPRTAFEKLTEEVRPFWQKDISAGIRLRRITISVEIRLAICLRLLAVGESWDLVGFFRVRRSTVDPILNEGLEIFSRVLSFPKFPSSRSELHRYAMQYKLSRRRPNLLNGCIGAIDGIAIKIRKPKEIPHAEFFCRKGFYAVNVQALVDSRYRFMFFPCLFPGSTHDPVAYQASKLRYYIEGNQNLISEFWIIGDEAYICTEFLITNYPKAECGEEESAFNYVLSQLRNHVEQAFGILCAKWLILQTLLQLTVRKSVKCVRVCMLLHNFCIDNRSCGDSLHGGLRRDEFRTVYLGTVRWDRLYWHGEETNVLAQSEDNDLHPSATIRSKKRESLLRVVRDKGIRRPPV